MRVLWIIFLVGCMSGAQRQAIDDSRALARQQEQKVARLEDRIANGEDLQKQLDAALRQLERSKNTLGMELAEGKRQKEESGRITGGLLKFGAGLAGETFGLPKIATGLGAAATLLQMFRKKSV